MLVLESVFICYNGRKEVFVIDKIIPIGVEFYKDGAYFSGFYNQMVSFIRSLFESALKANDSLKLAVVTGCLRISWESNVSAMAETSEKRFQRFLKPSRYRDGLFTGLNNLKVVSILDESYAKYFGFT